MTIGMYFGVTTVTSIIVTSFSTGFLLFASTTLGIAIAAIVLMPLSDQVVDRARTIHLGGRLRGCKQYTPKK